MPSSVRVVTADGTIHKAVGQLELEVNCNNKTNKISFVILPLIEPAFILGVDFWKAFNIAPQLFGPPDHRSNRSSASISVLSDSAPCLNDLFHLSESQLKELQMIQDSFAEISAEAIGLGKTPLVSHEIITQGEPVKQRTYPQSLPKKVIINAEIDKMLELGVIEKANSPWSNNVLIVTKKSGEHRFVLDPRLLNSVTRSDSYSLPFVNRILDHLRDAKFLTSLDLHKAFWQLPLHPDSKCKTAFFIEGRGQFQFTVCPFGLKNIPSQLQRLMDSLFSSEFGGRVFCYMDDILIASPDFETHLSDLRKVQAILKEANLTISLKKSVFCKKSLSFLGHIIDEHGLRSDPDKLTAMKLFPTPQCKKDVRSFLGLTGYYRRFIKDYSKIAVPLCKLTGGSRKTKSSTPFVWTSEAQEAFDALKKAMITAPCLKPPDFHAPFIITCDASAFAIGGVLSQEIDGHNHPVAYFSRKLNKAETNYSVTEKELLAVLDAIHHFRSFVEYTKFTVETDHSSLKWLRTLDNPSGRLARWATRLAQHDFDLVYRKGSENVVADSLSRNPVSSLKFPEPFTDVSDPWYNKIFSGCSEDPQLFPNYTIVDGHLYRKRINNKRKPDNHVWSLVVPASEVPQLVLAYHADKDSCHLGVVKTFHNLVQNFYWKNMKKSIKDIISKCEICKAYKVSNSGALGISSCPKRPAAPFHTISIDIVGPMVTSTEGFVYMLTVVDVFSKYLFVCPLRKATSVHIIKFLREAVFLKYNIPHTIILDNGPQFTSKLFQDFCNSFGVSQLYYNTFYTPQNNPVERYHLTLVTALGILVENNHRSWAQKLPAIVHNLNTSISLVTNYTPHYLVHGFEHIQHGSFYKSLSANPSSEEEPLASRLKTFDEYVRIHEEVSDAIIAAFKKHAIRYNLRRSERLLNEKDVVWRRSFVQSDKAAYFSAKLAPRFIKSIVLRKISNNVYLLGNEDGTQAGRFHIKDILKTN
jgi:transposase InsO family protein